MRLAFPTRAATLLALLVLAWGPCPGSVLNALRKAFPQGQAASPCCGCAGHAREERSPEDGPGDRCPCCDEQAVRRTARTAEPAPALPTPLPAAAATSRPAPPPLLATFEADIAEDANAPPAGALVGVVVLVV